MEFGISKVMLIFALQLADMVKLVDMPDLGSGAARRVGSSPIIRTKQNATHLFLESCIFLFFRSTKIHFNTHFVLLSPLSPLPFGPEPSGGRISVQSGLE